MIRSENTAVLERCLRSPVLFCTGESSGDLYGALLAEQIRGRVPNVRMFGIGGTRMQEAGVTILKSYQDMQVFGFGSALASLSASIRTYRHIVTLMRMIRPKTFIPVAYPGMNLLLCREAQRLHAEVHYFMPPQIWAWGSFRKYFVRRWVDQVISVFPFEYELYRDLGVHAELMTHPLKHVLRRYERTEAEPCIGFMPGSRLRDVRRHLRMMLDLVEQILVSRPDIRCVFIVPAGRPELYALVRTAAARLNLPGADQRVLVQHEDRYAVMKNCDMLVTTSGTASLEAYLMDVNQIFVHRPSRFDYYMLKPFLRIREFNLVNLLHGEAVVPAYVSRSAARLKQFIRTYLRHYLLD